MISVIVPVYNSEKYLAECIESILTQSYHKIELILVNDGSNDNSLQICKSYKDNQVFVVDKPNGGVSSARNAGLKIAQGEYIAFVDSDDSLPKDALQKLYDAITNTQADAAFGPFQYLYGDKFLPHSLRLKVGLYEFKTLLPDFIDDGTLSGFLIGSVWAALYRRDVLLNNNIQFAENLKNNEDGLFNFEFALHAHKLVVISDIIYNYRQVVFASKPVRKDEDFGKKVFDIIDNLSCDKKEYDYEIQKERRKVTLAWWNILHFYNDYNFVDSLKYINHILSGHNIRIGLKHMQFQKMNNVKKYFFFLMKFRMNLTMYISLKYIVPILDKRLKR